MITLRLQDVPVPPCVPMPPTWSCKQAIPPSESQPSPPQLAPHLQVEGVEDEGFSPHMHVGGMRGTLDVRVIAHAPAEVVHSQHRSLVHALWPQVLVVCRQRGGGECGQGSLLPAQLPPNRGNPDTTRQESTAPGQTQTWASTEIAWPSPFSSWCLSGRATSPQEPSSHRGASCQPVPAEMELKPKAKGGVSPSCTDTLTLDNEAHRIMGAMIWG